jgi:hypothetical protein
LRLHEELTGVDPGHDLLLSLLGFPHRRLIHEAKSDPLLLPHNARRADHWNERPYAVIWPRCIGAGLNLRILKPLSEHIIRVASIKDQTDYVRTRHTFRAAMGGRAACGMISFIYVVVNLVVGSKGCKFSASVRDAG